MHTALVIAKLIAVGLGLSITYQAYRGYRVYGSEPMLYVAIGFLFISVGSVIEGILFDVVGLSIFVAGTIHTTLVAAGMLIILYSLHGQMSQPTQGGDES